MTKHTLATRFLHVLLGCSLLAALSAPARAHSPLQTNEPQPATDRTSVGVVLELTDAPAADIYAAVSAAQVTTADELAAATQAQIALIEQAQQQLLSALAPLGATVIYRTQRVYNGIAVHVAPAALVQLAALPGVKAVHPLIAKTPANAHSVPYIGAPLLWSGSGAVQGVTGATQTIAIIDTGIDYLHTAFGGPGAGYAENNVAIIGDIVGFPSHKIIGGFDFSGDNYDADPENATYQSIPSPDADPMDCYNHGTHVAATAAGYGVNLDGSTFVGPYRPGIAPTALRIGPGVAPGALLYALKVFGCYGSSEITDQAIEWAVDPNGDGDFRDHVDVINMSLGSTMGSTEDTTSRATDRAAAVGIIVVASAGNSGNTFYAAGSPAVSSGAISVAATQLDSTIGAIDENETSADTLASFSSRGPRRGDSALKPDLAAPGNGIVSAGGGTGSNYAVLSGTSMASPHVAGAMALLAELHPTWSAVALKALAMNTAMPDVRTAASLVAQPAVPSLVGAGRINLANAARANAVAYNAANPNLVSVSFGAPGVIEQYHAVKGISVQNFGVQTTTFKLTYYAMSDAPGVKIDIPQELKAPPNSTANLDVSLTADARDLRRSRDPNLPDTQGLPRQWLSEESGMVLLWATPGRWHAAMTGNRAEPPNNSTAQGVADFTFDPITRQLTYQITLTGISSAALNDVTIRRGIPGTIQTGAPVHIIYTRGNVYVPGVALKGAVKLSEFDAMLLAAGSLYVNAATTAHPNGEVRATISPEQPVIKVPVYAAPRPLAAMHASVAKVDLGGTATMTVPLQLIGLDIRQSGYPTGYLSLASAVELYATSINGPPLDIATGSPNSYDHADLKYVGVTSDYPVTKNVATTTLAFGIATHEAWSSPREVEFSVFIDVNKDDSPDFRLYNSDQRAYNNRFAVSDAFVTALEDLRTTERTSQEFINGASAQSFDTGVFNNSVMLLPVHAKALGLTNQKSDFTYYIESKSIDVVGVIDRTPTLRYNVTHPALNLTNGQLGAPLLEDHNGTTIPIGVKIVDYLGSGSLGVLLLHYHNRADSAAEVMQLVNEHVIYLPIMQRR